MQHHPNRNHHEESDGVGQESKIEVGVLPAGPARNHYVDELGNKEEQIKKQG